MSEKSQETKDAEEALKRALEEDRAKQIREREERERQRKSDED